ncbi:hypothetical protein [Cryobacterium sp. 10C3]|uniref:hypothetical protein n=1 Tax=Cryobacterium sp. 10C3 TaxID=3048577 RepID=UPI002AB3D132|nr:hypothetical protein [Cryobacterium sp. 10C3]MDY7558242.1 hypothetical protein [Cryobacterium sp. 10C3]
MSSTITSYGLSRAEQNDRLRAGVREQQAVAGAAEGLGEHPADEGVVFADSDGGHGAIVRSARVPPV